jgi:hypothetical protein
MYPKQQLIYMIAFIALFIGSVILLFIQNSKISDLENIKEENVEVWLAKHDIKEGSKVNPNDIYPMAFPKANIYFRRLSKEEIVGKYANTSLLANEPIRYEKIIKIYKRKAIEGVKKKETDAPVQIKTNIPSEIQPKYDVYTAKIEMFKNLNFFIKANDKIDIIAVWPDNTKEDINVRYIASDVTVLGFTAHGEFQYDYKKDTIAKDRRELSIADEIILDLRPKEITNLLKLYYRGHNLARETRSSRSGRESASIPEGQLWIVSVGASLTDRTLSREKRSLKYNTYIKPSSKSKRSKKEKKVTVEYE